MGPGWLKRSKKIISGCSRTVDPWGRVARIAERRRPFMAEVDCGVRDRVTKARDTEGDSWQKKKRKKWVNDVADDEEMERQPRRLGRGEFYGKG